MNNNILQFYIQMKDLSSGIIGTVAKNTHTSAVKINRDLEGITSTNKKLGDSFSQVAKQARAANADIGKLAKAGGGSGGFNPMNFVKGLGAAYGVSKAIGFGKDAIGKAMDYGATEKSFGILTGNAGKGRDLATQLNSLQQNTILGPEVFKAAQTMLAFGIETDKVVKMEKQLGDVSMGNADKFEALTLAISQTTAAGRLQGQDLLQFVNAGFNPLQVMSEKWQEFGFSSKKSMGELKEMMEKGQISSAAVAKSLELATGAGGKFAGMMDEMAKTSAGKLQILQGQFENFKITVGNALMPIAEGLMDSASRTLEWLNLSKSAPEALAAEQGGVNTLVESITRLNEGNGIRKTLLEDLKRTYPTMFGNLNTETAKNADLLKSLTDINAAYKEKIALSQSDLQQNGIVKEIEYTKGILGRAQQQLDYMKKGNTGFFSTGMLSPYMQGWDNKAIRDLGFDEKSISGLQGFIDYGLKDLQRLAGDKSNIDKQNGALKLAQTMNQQRDSMSSVMDTYKKFLNDPTALHAAFAGNQAGANEFMKLGRSRTFANVQKMQGLLASGGTSPSSVISALGVNQNSGTRKGRSAADAAQGIVGGGPRQIFINGVKFADKIEINAVNTDAGLQQLEPKLAEYFMRVLNSGAKMQ